MNSMPHQTPQHRPMRIMDWLVVGLVACAVVLPIAMASAGSDVRVRVEPAVRIFAFSGCVLLLSWMWFGDGARSTVWNFLPPFWPWSRYAAGTVSRWIIVILLIAGTLMGIVSSRVAQ